MVHLECNLCGDAAVDPVLNLCGHLFCGPCLRNEFHRRRRATCRCPACGRRASPSRLTPIYGQGTGSEPCDDIDSKAGWGLLDGRPTPSGCADFDVMDIDAPPQADVVMMDVDGGTGEAGGDPMEVDGGGDQAVEGKGRGGGGGGGKEKMATTTKKKMVPLECHICLDDAEEPVATPCGHVFCCPCLFQWLDGRRWKCPMCKKPVSESMVTLVLPAPVDSGEKGRNRGAQQARIGSSGDAQTPQVRPTAVRCRRNGTPPMPTR